MDKNRHNKSFESIEQMLNGEILIIIDMFDSINNFKNKLNLIKNQLSEENYSPLPFCLQTIEKYGNICENDKAVQIIDNLIFGI